MTRSTLCLLFAALLAACGGSPTDPGGDSVTPTDPTKESWPTWAGNYRLTITASSTCAMPVTRYAWDVVVTNTGGTGINDEIAVALPGSARLKMVFFYGESSPSRLQGMIMFSTLPIQGSTLWVEVSMYPCVGAVTRTRGLGQITAGTCSGTLILEPDQFSTDPIASCNAANHSFSLVPR